MANPEWDNYDPDSDLLKPYKYAWPKADHTVDAVVFGIDEGLLKILLIERGRKKEPFYGRWALPGGFIRMEETLEQAVRRELEEETGLTLSYLEQLYTFGAPHRDPRGRVISTAYLGLVRPSEVAVEGGDDAAKAEWFPVGDLEGVGDDAIAKIEKGIPLAFDHPKIVRCALRRLRSKLRWQPVGIELLPRKFTMTELRVVYEIILGEKLDKRNFRTKVMRFGVLAPAKGKRTGRHRPAQLYTFDRARYDLLRELGEDFEV